MSLTMLILLWLSNSLMATGIIIFIAAIFVDQITNKETFKSLHKESDMSIALSLSNMASTYLCSIGLMVMAIGIKVLWT